MAWRSSETAYQMDQRVTHHSPPGERTTGLETSGNDTLETVENRIGEDLTRKLESIEDSSGDVDFRKLTGAEVMRWMGICGVPVAVGKVARSTADDEVSRTYRNFGRKN